MKKTKNQARQQPEAPAAPKTETQPYREISSGIVPMRYIEVFGNFRKVFDPKSLAELADNIKKVGVLVPVLLRPNGQKGGEYYYLVAGERRLRAANAAKLTEIPARVLDVNEAEAAEIQALENLHRKDLGPIEEARAFKTLLDSGSHTVKELADRIGKEMNYVYRAIRLLDLSKEALQALEDGKITPAMGHQLLRAPKEIQKSMMQDVLNGHFATARDLAEAITERTGRDLVHALFPKDKDFAGEPACSSCPYNTGNQGMLFDGAKKGNCTNSACYDKKTRSFMSAVADDQAKKLGVENIGAVKRDYGNGLEGKKNAILVTPSEDMLKLVAKQPKKFAVAVVEPSYAGGKTDVQLVCTDSSVLPRDVAAGVSPQAKAARKKLLADQRLENEIQAAMFKLAFDKLPDQPTKQMAMTIASALDKSYASRSIWKGLGLAKKGSFPVEASELEKLPTGGLLKLTFLLAVGDFTDYRGDRRKEYLAARLNPKELRAAAKETT